MLHGTKGSNATATPAQAMPSTAAFVGSRWCWARYGILFLVAALVTAASIIGSLANGRLAWGVPQYDDVSYFEDALKRMPILAEQGPAGLVREHWRRPPHSPWSSYAALTGYLLFGTSLWAPYVMNALVVFIALVMIDIMLRERPWWMRLALSALFLSMPFTERLLLEFRPDPFCALVTAFGMWLLIRAPLAELRPSQAIGIGLIWGATLWIKPTVFVQTAVFLLAALGWNALQAWRERPRPVRTFLRNSALCALVTALVAAPHLAPTLPEYLAYMRQHMFGESRYLWAFRGEFVEHVNYYLLGRGGDFMFRSTFPLLALVTLATLVCAVATARHAIVRETLALVVLLMTCWLLPTLNGVKSPFFGMTFGCLLLFTVVRCLGFWLGGDVGLPRRYALPTGLAALGALAAFWPWPSFRPVRPGSLRGSFGSFSQDVYQEVRARLPADGNACVALPITGFLNEHVLRWQFLRDQAAPPRCKSSWYAPDLAEHWRLIEQADMVVLPEPDLLPKLIPGEYPFVPVYGQLFAQVQADPRFRLAFTGPALHGKNMLIYVRQAAGPTLDDAIQPVSTAHPDELGAP